jgi:predicted DNA-binding ribbon-helix-helix protein
MTDTAIRKHSVVISGVRTSVSLEAEFWAEVKRMAEAAQKPVSEIIEGIKRERGTSSMSSAIRLAILRDLRERAFPPAPATQPEMEGAR